MASVYQVWSEGSFVHSYDLLADAKKRAEAGAGEGELISINERMKDVFDAKAKSAEVKWRRKKRGYTNPTTGETFPPNSLVPFWVGNLTEQRNWPETGWAREEKA